MEVVATGLWPVELCAALGFERRPRGAVATELATIESLRKVPARVILLLIESADRKNTDKARVGIGTPIEGILAHFVDQTFGTWRCCAHYPVARKAARALPTCAD